MTNNNNCKLSDTNLALAAARIITCTFRLWDAWFLYPTTQLGWGMQHTWSESRDARGPPSSGPVAHHIILLILNRPPPCLARVQGRWGQARWFRDWPPGGQLLGAGSSLPSHLPATSEDDCGLTGTLTQAVMNMKGLHFWGDEYYKRDRKEGTVDCARNVHPWVLGGLCQTCAADFT